MRVLIADDDADLRSLMIVAVEKAGYEVAAAVGDGLEAWHVMQTAEVGLAVLDVSMPGLTGVELTQLIRLDPGLRTIPVLVITANVQSSMAESVYGAGANGLITKPFRVSELVQSLHRIADRPL